MKIIKTSRCIKGATGDIELNRTQYLEELKSGVMKEVSSEVDDLTFRTTRSSLIVYVVWMDKTMGFEVPFEDLSFEQEGLEVDISYISNTIIDEIERSLDER